MDLKPRTLLRRVFDFARAELERRSRPPEEEGEHGALPAVPRAPRVPVEADAGSEHSSERPTPLVLEVMRGDDGVLRAHWSIGPADIARSERLAGDQAILCLRLVAFEGARDDVRREVVDRPFVERVGSCELGASDVRGVVAVGLRAGERFVSIAHHIV